MYVLSMADRQLFEDGGLMRNWWVKTGKVAFLCKKASDSHSQALRSGV